MKKKKSSLEVLYSKVKFITDTSIDKPASKPLSSKKLEEANRILANMKFEAFN